MMDICSVGFLHLIFQEIKMKIPKVDTDFWIVKIDSIGNIDWQKTIGGNQNDYLVKLIQVIDGGYMIGGESLSDISGDKTEDCIGHY